MQTSGLQQLLACVRRGTSSALLSSSGSPFNRSFASSTKNPVYVVFGAAGGIGSALVQRLSGQQDAKVIQVDDAKSGELQGEAHQADASDFRQVEKVMQQIRDQYQCVHGIANCIGDASIMKAAHITTEDEYEHIMRTNVKTAFNILKAGVPAMMTEGGSIVLATAAISHMGAANHDIVAAAKGAVSSLALGAAATYSLYNVRVNCVAPGLIQTPMTETMTGSKQAKDASLKMIPWGDWGSRKKRQLRLSFSCTRATALSLHRH